MWVGLFNFPVRLRTIVVSPLIDAAFCALTAFSACAIPVSSLLIREIVSTRVSKPSGGVLASSKVVAGPVSYFSGA